MRPPVQLTAVLMRCCCCCCCCCYKIVDTVSLAQQWCKFHMGSDGQHDTCSIPYGALNCLLTRKLCLLVTLRFMKSVKFWGRRPQTVHTVHICRVSSKQQLCTSTATTEQRVLYTCNAAAANSHLCNEIVSWHEAGPDVCCPGVRLLQAVHVQCCMCSNSTCW
jgi:hypothetical protein